ncbi:hypothetical protein DFQ26_004290 [Actinomortierella ambigua]|nr:hypothetical protein DFQ26_004290 [Actinomortierella ambigua]
MTQPEDISPTARFVAAAEAANAPTEVSNAIEGEVLKFPELTHQRLENCAFASWYPLFQGVTIKSKAIPLPEEFVKYLNADKLFIPGQSGVAVVLSDAEEWSDSDEDEDEDPMERLKKLGTSNSQNEGFSSDDDDEEEEDDEVSSAPFFPELEREIQGTIDEFGGEVFPKLNWSSPRDAAWISATNTLKCHNVSDIFLLLKSSDFIVHDMGHAYEDCSDEHAGAGSGVRTRPENLYLVLRKWFDLSPSMEFRCFVVNNELVGISQRDMTYYEFLKDIKEDVEDMIEDFFEDHIQNKFPDPDYTFDVYITRNRERIYLIDFNPLAQKTDSLLYGWEEILTAKEPLSLRLLPSEEAGRHMRQPFEFNRYPSDVTDLSNGQTVAEFAEEFYKKVQAAATN